MRLADLVPEVSVRPQQDEAFSEVFSALWGEDPVDIVFLEAPTGVGKSVIGLGLCRYVESTGGSSFMVTPQKILQEQLRSWNGLSIMKGRSNYPCGMFKSLTAGDAPCVKNAAIRSVNPSVCGDDACAFFKALTEAQASKAVVHNYTGLMAQSRLSKFFERRDLLILDEGHSAPDWIRNYASTELTRDDLAAMTTQDPPEDPTDFMPWIRALIGGMDRIPEGMPDRLVQVVIRMKSESKVYGVPDETEMENLKLRHHTESLENKLPRFSEWVLQHLGDDTALTPWDVKFVRGWRNTPDTWKMTPIKVAPLAPMLLGLGKKVVVMSATILDPRLLAMELGVSKSRFKYVEIDSAFPAENRPIIVKPVGSMNWANRRDTTPKIIDAIVRIAEHHGSFPGIVHSVSHQLAKDIVDGLRQHPKMPADRTIVQLPIGSNRDTVVSDFLSGRLGPNPILVGPGLTEGVDGKDDSARWQVFAKAPWMAMDDPVVRFLTNHPSDNVREWGNKWYLWKAAQAFVQGCGRVVRTPEDWGYTYVLDDSFSRIIASRYIPEYVKAAVSRRS